MPIPAVMIPSRDRVGDSKRRVYWTGKQVMSLIIPPEINLIRKSSGHPDDERISDLTPGDTHVRIESGELRRAS